MGKKSTLFDYFSKPKIPTVLSENNTANNFLNTQANLNISAISPEDLIKIDNSPTKAIIVENKKDKSNFTAF